MIRVSESIANIRGELQIKKQHGTEIKLEERGEKRTDHQTSVKNEKIY